MPRALVTAWQIVGILNTGLNSNVLGYQSSKSIPKIADGHRTTVKSPINRTLALRSHHTCYDRTRKHSLPMVGIIM